MDYIGWMRVSLIAITGGGGGGGVCRQFLLYMRTQGGGMADCREKNEKRYGFYGREWTHFSIARPIEAGI